MNDISSLDPDELAKACADEMWKNDNASRGLGIEIVEISAGRAQRVLDKRVQE